MKLCRRCAAPVTALNVILDRNGVCNLCHTYEQTGAQLTDTARMAGLFGRDWKCWPVPAAASDCSKFSAGLCACGTTCSENG